MTLIIPTAGVDYHVVIKSGPPNSPKYLGLMLPDLASLQREAYTPFAPATRQGQPGTQDYSVALQWALNEDWSGGTACLMEQMVQSAGYGYALGRNAAAAGCGTTLFTAQKGRVMPAPAHVAAGTLTNIKQFIVFDGCLFALTSATPGLVYKYDADGDTPTDDVAGLSAAGTQMFTDGAKLYVCQGAANAVRTKVADTHGTGAWSNATYNAHFVCARDDGIIAYVATATLTPGLISGSSPPANYGAAVMGWSGTTATNLKYWKGNVLVFKPEGIFAWNRGHVEPVYDCGDQYDANNFTKCAIARDLLVTNVKNQIIWTADGYRWDYIPLEDVGGFVAVNSLAASGHGPLFIGAKIAPLEVAVANSGAKSVTTPASDLTNDTAVGIAAWSNPLKAGASDDDYATTLIGLQSQGPLSGGAPTNDAAAGNVAWTNPGNAQTSNNSRATAAVGGLNTGATSFSTIVDDDSAGSVAWTNPANAGASDDAYATAVMGAGQITHWLKGTGAGLSVPTGATISGIKVEVEAKHSGTGGTPQLAVYLLKAGAFVAYKTANMTGGAVDTVYSLGGGSDLWGVTWLPADVNDANFGAAAVVTITGVAGTISVDHITITVYYNQAGPTNYLKSLGYSFAVPTGATVQGLVVEIECSTDAATTPATLYAKLVIGGVVQAQARSIAVPGAEAYVALGSASDVWGGGPTPAQVNGATFGVVVYANGTEGQTISIDHIRLTVYWGATQSQYLKGLNFAASLPAGVTVTGIKVEAECKSTVNDPTLVLVACLVKGGVIQAPIPGWDDNVRWVKPTTTEAYLTLGGAADLWSNTWTVSQVNAADFGVVVYAQSAVGQTVSVDHVRVTVYWNQGAGSNNYIFAWEGPGRGGLNPLWSDAAGANPMYALGLTSLYDSTAVRLYTCSDNANWKTRYISLTTRYTPASFDVDETNVSYLLLTKFSANFRTVNKWLYEVVLSVTNPSNTTFAKISYSKDGADYVQCQDEHGVAVTLTLNEPVKGCYVPGDTVFTYIIFKLELWTTSATSAASITHFNARGDVMVRAREQFQMPVLCTESVKPLRGEAENGVLIREKLTEALGQGYPVQLQLHDGSWHLCLNRSPSPLHAIKMSKVNEATMELEEYTVTQVVLMEVDPLDSAGNYIAWTPG